uniref:Lipase-like C-terminal domain-containing protein n=1 Tax=Globisporangium ultimum (strain ATCC 200006 / CBS 805.95 / DAOM BR144) TaxID=431595 RepID=K3WCV2_GLOUD
MTGLLRRPCLALCLLLASWICSFSSVHAGNKYPIILVHGFAGWGRDELLGFKYWGGLHGDYQAQLQTQGYEVYTATVGPFSSNWDRACELYAYIKGGTVNYGAKHSATHGHKATGRTFPGIYPKWGEVVNGQVQKVHLVGHSMGGQTIRMLAQLLAEGTKGAPIQEDASSHPLFAGGKDWIHSITTISSPNQGTLLADGLSTVGDLIEDAVVGVFSVLGAVGSSASAVYDAKLDQWGISGRASGESLTAYIKRVFSSQMFQPGFKDICLYSLSHTGAAEENTWVKTLPSVYYYSFSTQDTFRLVRVVLPRPQSMLLPLQPLSVFMGSSYPLKNGYTQDWQPNDGAVNTISMRYDGKSDVVDTGAVAKTGRWHHMSTFTTLDHMAVIGVKLLQDAFEIYSTQARLLSDLPVTGTSSRKLLRGSNDHVVASDVIAQHKNVEAALNAFDEQRELRIVCSSPADATTARLCKEHYSM